MNKFYVYVHRRASDNEVFYVGKGCGLRAWNYNNRNAYWTNVKNKHGVVVDIVFDNLSEEDSLRIEKDTITEFLYFGYPLTNLTSGGEKPNVISDDSRKKMSDARKGKKRSEGSVKKTAEAHKGMKRSLQTCERISQALKGKKVPRERAIRSNLKRTGTLSSVADKTIYSFINEDGTVFKGTRMELCESLNVSKKAIGKLFGKCKRNSSHGWSILKEQNEN